MHCQHWIEFTPTPLWQTAQGNAPESRRRSSLDPETMNFVFFIWTLSALRSIPSFQTFNLAMHFSSKSAIMTRSSAYRSSHGTPEQNRRDRASSTSMKSKGLRTDPWCTPTLTPSLYWLLTRTRLLTSVYMPCMTRTAHSSTPKLLLKGKRNLNVVMLHIKLRRKKYRLT